MFRVACFHLILYKVEQEPEHPNVNGPGPAADPVCGQSARFPRQKREEGIKGNILYYSAISTI